MAKRAKLDAAGLVDEAECAKFLRRISARVATLEADLKANSEATFTRKLAELETASDYLPRKCKGLLSDEEISKTRAAVMSGVKAVTIYQEAPTRTTATLKESTTALHRAMGILNATADVIDDEERQGFIKGLTNAAIGGLALISIPVALNEFVLFVVPLAFAYLGFSGVGAQFVYNLFKRKSKHAPMPADDSDESLIA